MDRGVARFLCSSLAAAVAAGAVCSGGRVGENRSIYDDPVDAYCYAIFWSCMMMTIGGLPHPETNLGLVFVTFKRPL